MLPLRLRSGGRLSTVNSSTAFFGQAVNCQLSTVNCQLLTVL
ncbi:MULTISPECIES: hypothetical protein [unclassified Microcoleus]|nr:MULTISPECIES: hypothetical protein [unclassified Microcoleus]